jgi:hypothetical protein
VFAALSTHLQALETSAHWDGCTRYVVESRPVGLAVRPAFAVIEGECQPFTSELETVSIPNEADTPVVWTARRLDRHLAEHYGMRIRTGDVHIPAGGQSLLDLLDTQVSAGDGIVWYVRRNPNGAPTIRFMAVGSVPTDNGVDLDELPHMPRAPGPPPSLPPADRAKAEEANRLMRRTAEECLATVRAAIAANPDTNPETLEIHCVDYLKEQPDPR